VLLVEEADLKVLKKWNCFNMLTSDKEEKVRERVVEM
jgi:hypothetical protein